MIEIPLTHGRIALIDDEDAELVSGHTWRAIVSKKTAYAVRNCSRLPGPRRLVVMHRVILGLTDPRVFVDHINGNGVDNSRANLRIATNAQNLRNRSTPICNTSGVKGVFARRGGRRWRAQIKVDDRALYLGDFDTREEAAAAYDAKAAELFGPFARLNFAAEEAGRV